MVSTVMNTGRLLSGSTTDTSAILTPTNDMVEHGEGSVRDISKHTRFASSAKRKVALPLPRKCITFYRWQTVVRTTK